MHMCLFKNVSNVLNLSQQHAISCHGHPSILSTLRSWQYDDKVPEYFVIIEDKAAEKRAEVDRIRESTDRPVSWFQNL